MRWYHFSILLTSGLLHAEYIQIGQPSDWVEGTSETRDDGANREHYNRAALLPWKHFMGDWHDADNKEQGDRAYDVTKVIDDDSIKRTEWDVTGLAKEWASGFHKNQGMLLRAIDGKGTIVFASRENNAAKLRPALILQGSKNTLTLKPVADTYLTESTYRSQGLSNELRVSQSSSHLLLRFKLPPESQLGSLNSARLILHTTKQFGSTSIGVFRCQQGQHNPQSKPIPGLAARYPGDRGISNDQAVLFATSFESPTWEATWTQVAPKEKIGLVDPKDTFQEFTPLQGKALQARIAQGTNLGLNTLYKFQNETGKEHEEIYFRYYLRLANDWNQTIQGGKLPGISGTYGRAGWGGRKVNGTDGWSARGLFMKTIESGNPLTGKTPIGFYCYHADMKDRYGANWVWQRDYRGYLEKNRWYAIEQFCRMNTPKKKDGILRAWVDGHLAFEKTDIRFRDSDALKIEQIWMNLYHGGTKPSPHDQHIFIDQVVIAKEYIGPIAR